MYDYIRLGRKKVWCNPYRKQLLFQLAIFKLQLPVYIVACLLDELQYPVKQRVYIHSDFVLWRNIVLVSYYCYTSVLL